MTTRDWLENVSQAGCDDMGHRITRPWMRTQMLLGGCWLLATVGCHDLSSLAGRQTLPSGVQDPNTYHTATGARALYQTTLKAFQYSTDGTGTGGAPGAFVSFTLVSGLLSDELTTGDRGCTTCVIDPVDARQLADIDDPVNNVYSGLQSVRNDASEAIGALAAYDSSAVSAALRGHLMALQGYAEILLADVYCSGIPLSTLDFSGDYTYQAGSPTDAVYHDAITKFQTALPLAHDSARLVNLARVGLGRAWLARGEYDSAAAAVAQTPNTFTYQFLVDWSRGLTDGFSLFYSPVGFDGSGHVTSGRGGTVADREGTNGLDYLSSNDPRTAAQSPGLSPFGFPLLVPTKYGGATVGISPIIVASGVEARLIEAENALHHGQYDTWLAKMNLARQLTAPTLPPLQDPGASVDDSARVNLLFRERAFDLFLTGHRQGDLRRLVRQYRRSILGVYPVGSYPLGGSYGPSVTLPIPFVESTNPLFTGCLSRGA